MKKIVDLEVSRWFEAEEVGDKAVNQNKEDGTRKARLNLLPLP
jgi:hypothetical protein